LACMYNKFFCLRCASTQARHAYQFMRCVGWAVSRSGNIEVRVLLPFGFQALYFLPVTRLVSAYSVDA
jgi:hypothetical protein